MPVTAFFLVDPRAVYPGPAERHLADLSTDLTARVDTNQLGHGLLPSLRMAQAVWWSLPPPTADAGWNLESR